MIATAALAITLIALLAFHGYREREHDRERRALLDRIQAPAASQIAALEAAAPRREPLPVPEPLPVLKDMDLQLAEMFDSPGGS